VLRKLFRRNSRYQDPFKGLSNREIYAGLLDGRFGPRWPDERVQAGYAGMYGPALLKRAFDFIDILDRDGAFKKEWKGLDYGCGWGRFPSSLLSKGTADQLDVCDAWERTLEIIGQLNYRNKIFKVSELLEPSEIPADTYDFIMSFSVFTHLSPIAFEHNIPILLKGLKKDGSLYITVRHDEFFDHKYPDKAAELRAILKRDKVVFLDTAGDMTGEKVFGDTILTEAYLERFGTVRYLGQPHSLQHVYCYENRGSR